MSGRLCRYTEEEFHDKFPEIERYLQTYRDKLDLRQKVRHVSGLSMGVRRPWHILIRKS